MQMEEHEYIRKTLERYTNCRIEDICDHILINTKWSEVKRHLISEW